MTKIDTTKDFIKHVGSLNKASLLVRSLLSDKEHLSSSIGKRGNLIVYARGKQNSFDWSYNPTYKTVRVDYTDGRPEPELENKEKPEYYVVWIEGLSPEKGEKVLSLDGGNSYTTKMTQAMRVLPEDKETVKEILRGRGVAEWALQNCMVRTNYAPKGTIYKL